MRLWEIDYTKILNGCASSPLVERLAYLAEELPHEWAAVYREASGRPTDVCVVPFDTFNYVFDYYDSFGNSQHPDYDSKQDSRLVVAFGISAPKRSSRDDGRLKGWVGPTEKHFGSEWDKGHFIAHSIGGAVFQSEVNVFPQLRALNRGRSEEGRRFVAMEKYCRDNAGTFCFHRPIYADGSARPAKLEFGFLDREGKLRTATFNNTLRLHQRP